MPENQTDQACLIPSSIKAVARDCGLQLAAALTLDDWNFLPQNAHKEGTTGIFARAPPPAPAGPQAERSVIFAVFASRQLHHCPPSTLAMVAGFSETIVASWSPMPTGGMSVPCATLPAGLYWRYGNPSSSRNPGDA
ncbi:hypothetical protein PG984_002214 [Apiospora sp. TS-2023a]